MRYYALLLGVFFITAYPAKKCQKPSEKKRDHVSAQIAFNFKRPRKYSRLYWEILKANYEHAEALAKQTLSKKGQIGLHEAELLLGYYERKKEEQRGLDTSDIFLYRSLCKIIKE